LRKARISAVRSVAVMVPSVRGDTSEIVLVQKLNFL